MRRKQGSTCLIIGVNRILQQHSQAKRIPTAKPRRIIERDIRNPALRTSRLSAPHPRTARPAASMDAAAAEKSNLPITARPA